ncbi:hypothetical protein H257_12152 [Aphanomyces astaci]|uniref:Uncharacterized protein n=1 Tax=Aphanomyces astaci TaxID=112090 RepID=W4G0H3_APHAT|nr:hypothetical protein H257_12152 [Aphanomyces astaci]ETV72786.1 hypothetical protein H257_12152 [Aphanomyces astaci]|eukprot:XP_009837572.1 hypothetical protein H257_12152 [Aphanomyces astaci]
MDLLCRLCYTALPLPHMTSWKFAKVPLSRGTRSLHLVSSMWMSLPSTYLSAMRATETCHTWPCCIVLNQKHSSTRANSLGLQVLRPYTALAWVESWELWFFA